MALTTEQINEYFATEGTKANPMSPADWLASQTGNIDNNTDNDTTTSGQNLFDTDYYNQDRNADLEYVARKEQEWAGAAATNQGWVKPTFVKTLDADVIGMYINALAYGGYTIGDIVNDIKRREMAKDGNVDAKNLTIIDPDMIREVYYSTPEGNQALTQTAKTIPTFNLQGLLNPELLQYGMDIPDELFKIFTPLQDRDSQEFKDAVADTKLAYIDKFNNQLEADTEQETVQADYDMKVFKEELDKVYGIALSENTDKAWSQIEALEENFSQRGLAGSGFQNEAIDDELKATRETNRRARDEKLTKEEAKKVAHYRSYATEEEIAALTPEEREKYKLTPSAEILAKFSLEEMRKIDPNATDAELQAYRDTFIDANGNYRSTLYKNYYKGLEANAIARKSTAESMVLQKAMDDEQRAGEVWDNQHSFSDATNEQQRIIDEAAGVQSGKEQGKVNPKINPEDNSGTTSPQVTPEQEAQWKSIQESAKKIQDQMNPKITPEENSVTISPQVIPEQEDQWKSIQEAAKKIQDQMNPKTTVDSNVSAPVAPAVTTTPTQYAGGKAPDDPSNRYNTATGKLNPNYKG